MSLVDAKHVITPTIEFKKVDIDYSTYSFSRVVPMSGSQSVTVPAASTIDTLFKIPTKVHNWAKSVLAFDVSIATPGVTPKFNWTYENGMGLISQVQLFTRGGQYICDINNFQNYIELTRPIKTPLREFDTNSREDRFYPMNAVAAAGVDRPEGALMLNKKSYRETKYLSVGADAKASTYQVNFNMGAIADSIFSVNKDIYFPEIIMLRILWGPGKKNAFFTPSATDATTNAVVLAADTTVSNLTLHLAVEKNPQICAEIIQKVQSGGFNMLLPFIFSFKTSLSGTSQTVSQRFTRANGHTLKRIIHSIVNSTEDTNTAYDHSNISVGDAKETPGAKVTSYVTYLDNSREQEFDVNCATTPGLDWMIHKPMLKGTPLGLDKSIYQYRWFHCSDYSGERLPGDDPFPVENANLVSGLSLSTEHKWDIYCTTVAGTYNHYTYVITQKTLSIAPGMVMAT
jgi:hypothetical protein